MAKDVWDKLNILVAALIPIVIAYSGYVINDNLKSRELKAQEFGVAVSILQQDPKKTPEFSALRKWALEVFVDFTGQKLPEAARRELETKPLPRVTTMATPPASYLPGEFVLGESFLGGPPPGPSKGKH